MPLHAAVQAQMRAEMQAQQAQLRAEFKAEMREMSGKIDTLLQQGNKRK